MGWKFNPFTGTLDLVDTSKSQSIAWNRSGNVPKNTWLLNEEVPSNKCGVVVSMIESTVKKVVTSNEDPSIITLELYTHDGDGINLVLLGTVTTLAQRTNSFDVSMSVPAGKQVAIKTANTPGNTGKNLVVSAIVEGDLA